ncbi:MAG: molybdopterin molybdotransferase MoeA [Candidatus Caldarchaeum sp.]
MYRRVEKFTDVWEAQRMLLSFVKPVQDVEEVNVFEAFGRVAAEAVRSPRDLPAHHSSHMDGFAVSSSSVEKASADNPVRLKVVGECAPGKQPSIKLGPGEAARILTGGFLPEGADAVIPQEDVVKEDGVVVVRTPVEKMQYVDRRGFDVEAGRELFGRGHVLKASDLALMASLGLRTVRVVRRPRMGMMAVGDELTDSFDEASSGKILNTHAYVVRKLAEASGANVVNLGIVPDNPAAIHGKIIEYSGKLDILVSIAGSSISERDVSSLTARSFEVFVHGLTLQPGRVGGFALVNGTPLVMLPGLIMSTLNVFMFLAYPCLRRLQGQEPRFYHRRVVARLTEKVGFRKFIDFVKVVWVRLEELEDGLACRPVLGESSGMSIPSRADGFIIAPPGVSDMPRGMDVWVYLPPSL